MEQRSKMNERLRVRKRSGTESRGGEVELGLEGAWGLPADLEGTGEASLGTGEGWR